MAYIPIALVVLMVIPLIYTAQICPGCSGNLPRPKNCTSTCSPSNDRCPSGMKCCFSSGQSCGHQCITSKDNTAKSGTCPTNNGAQTVCDLCECDVDNDCRGTAKCCSAGCGSKKCLTPTGR